MSSHTPLGAVLNRQPLVYTLCTPCELLPTHWTTSWLLNKVAPRYTSKLLPIGQPLPFRQGLSPVFLTVSWLCNSPYTSVSHHRDLQRASPASPDNICCHNVQWGHNCNPLSFLLHPLKYYYYYPYSSLTAYMPGKTAYRRNSSQKYSKTVNVKDTNYTWQQHTTWWFKSIPDPH